MKTILLFLFFLPNLSVSQSERDEKLNKVFGNHQNKTQSFESGEKINKKNQSSIYRGQPYSVTRPNFNRITYFDYYRYNWYGWGAPYYGYIGYTPIFYYDRFGLRYPSRIYEMSDGTTKVVDGKKINYRLGLGYGHKDNLSFWTSVGGKTFMIFEFTTIMQVDRSSFLYNVRMDEVIRWNDKQLEDLHSGGTFYMGIGTKFSKLGGYLMMGYGEETHNLQFFDELFILSNNGRYSIRDFEESFFTGKFGVIYDHKYLSIKTDYDPFRDKFNLGLGVSF